MFTLRRLLTTVKDKDEPEDGLGALYKIKCFDYQATYIGETDRNLTTRLNEHFDLDYAPLMSRLTERVLLHDNS